MKTMKMIKSYSSLKPAVSQIVKPDFKKNSVYNKYFTVFKGMYSHMKDLMHKNEEITR
jgi:hypothetical protein